MYIILCIIYGVHNIWKGIYMRRVILASLDIYLIKGFIIIFVLMKTYDKRDEGNYKTKFIKSLALYYIDVYT